MCAWSVQLEHRRGIPWLMADQNFFVRCCASLQAFPCFMASAGRQRGHRVLKSSRSRTTKSCQVGGCA
jgi:hypothetical protein